MNKTTLFESFKWIGISFLVVSSYIALGGFHVGPISLRLIVSFGLLGYTLLLGNTEYRPTREIKMYFIYLAFYVFISVLNFTAFNFEFIKKLIVYHFVSCTAIFAFPRFFKTEASIRGAYFAIVVLFLFNAFITYLQFKDSPLGWAIGMYINPINIEELEEMQQYIGEGNFHVAILMGIMGDPVANGYFVATMLPVMTYFVWDKIGLKTIWAAIMFVIVGCCIYMIQQRMALIVAASYIITILALKVKRPSFMSFLIIALLALTTIYVFYQSMDVSEFGRLGTIEENEIRMNTLTVLKDFLSHPHQIILGYNPVGTDMDLYVFRTLGHNTFLSVLYRSGIFLLLIYIILFIRLCTSLIKIVWFSRRVKDYRTQGMALGCLCFLLYSQTHSTGVQTGNIMFWMLFMLTLQSHRVMYKDIIHYSSRGRRIVELQTE